MRKLSASQKDSLKTIRESGQNVVIEDGWLIYLASAQTCPFGVGRNMNQPAVEIIQQRMERLSISVEVMYRAKRNLKAKQHGYNAMLLIAQGKYEAAETELRQASNYQLSENAYIEIYRMPEPEIKGMAA